MSEGANGIPAVIMGLGPIGQAIARAALEETEIQLVGAVDPALAGRRLDEVLGMGPALGIAAEPRKAFAAARGGVVLHATGSSFERVAPELAQAVEAGLSVVSTCEELAWPWLRFEEQAERLAALAEAREVAVVGVGVNPGFALDRLPAFLSQVTGPVRHVRATRVQDAATRREALRRKVGVGMELDAFDAANERDEIGHVGLVESAALAAAGCGFAVDEVEVETAPMLAEEDIGGPAPLRKGQVAGVHQVARGFLDEIERVRLELVIAVGAEDPRDEVELDARPPVRILVRGGFPGDEATAWAVVHAVPAVMERHGLLSVLDLPAGR